MCRPLALIALALLSLASAACGKDEPERTPEQQVNHDFAELSWTLMEPLGSSKNCHEIGEALALWETANGARFRELAAKITTLHGADAKNVGNVEYRFKEVASRCVHPEGGDKYPVPMRVHDDDVARVFAMFPELETGYELR